MAYEPTEWANGDVITAEKLNKIENALASYAPAIVDVSEEDMTWYFFEADGTPGGYAVVANMSAEEFDALLNGGRSVVFHIPEKPSDVGSASDHFPALAVRVALGKSAVGEPTVPDLFFNADSVPSTVTELDFGPGPFGPDGELVPSFLVIIDNVG